jgi:hemoglobin
MISSTEKLDRISEEGIRRLVDAFYVKVRRDPELAPIFCARSRVTGNRI